MFTGDSSAKKSAGIAVSNSGAGTTRRTRSGCTSSLRDVRLSSTATSGGSIFSRSHSDMIRTTPRSETTSGVVTASTVSAISTATEVTSLMTDPGVDDGQVRPRPDRGEDVAGGTAGDLLGVLALLRRQQHSHPARVRVHRLTQMAAGQLLGDAGEIDDAASVGEVEEGAQVARMQVVLDQADRGLPSSRAASARWIAIVVVPTPPLAPTIVTTRPSPTMSEPDSRSARRRSACVHAAAAITLVSSFSNPSGSAITSRAPACIPPRSSSGESG